ncbi:MAG: heavy metal-binding domain-containing protein [Scytonema hyalinum WJT4-NPBG1]|jgi:uncharacterized protein YbjQ (UPF0145 family)|nr:heavy metal-binding domain-containing protein [Scytonema hyalinum WJT4-NPBG1]
MPFWWQKFGEDKQKREARAKSLKVLKMGKIPLEAQHRIQLQKDESNNFFASELTNTEHLLMREAGYEPIGLVTGTSFYRVSHQDYFRNLLGGSALLKRDVLQDPQDLQGSSNCNCPRCVQEYWGFMGEIPLLTQIQLEARELAIDRLQQEAALLGAHGVIGVYLKSQEHDWSSKAIEFTAIGTAIRLPNRALEQHPFITNLSGQEFWKLQQAGYYPKGLVIGLCSYYVRPSNLTNAIMNSHLLFQSAQSLTKEFREFSQQELDEYTEGIKSACRLARSRLTENTYKCEAEGAVGVSVGTYIKDIEYERGELKARDLLIHCLAVGTAIVFDKQCTRSSISSPLLSYNLAASKLEHWKYSKLR